MAIAAGARVLMDPDSPGSPTLAGICLMSVAFGLAEPLGPAPLWPAFALTLALLALGEPEPGRVESPWSLRLLVLLCALGALLLLGLVWSLPSSPWTTPPPERRDLEPLALLGGALAMGLPLLVVLTRSRR